MADSGLPRRHPPGARPLAEQSARPGRSFFFRPADAVSQVGGPEVEQRTLAHLRRLRQQVPGIGGSMVATSEGLLVTHDMLDLEPGHAAAVIATTLSVVREAARLTSRGQLREAVVHGTTGYLAVFAVGAEAALAVFGDKDLNVGMLHYQTREAVRHLEKDAHEFRRFATSLPVP